MSKSGPVWLIGLDGAAFDILNPMMDAGKLPIIDGLVKNGASGILKSSIVPFTPQAWASVITGNNPGKHGVFGFTRQIPGQAPQFLSSRSIEGDKIWTRLGRRGMTSLVVNVPLTYPPEPLKGVMVTGMMTPSLESEFTYPRELKERLLSRYPDYRLNVEAGISRSRNTNVLDELETVMDIQVQATLEYIGEMKPDFVFFVFILPDRIQHMFGKLVHPGSGHYDSRRTADWRARICESYTRMDESIGRLIAAAPSDTNILLASDHGFTVDSGSFYSNDFLAGLGLLTLKQGSGQSLARSIIRRFNVSAVKKFIPRRFLGGTVNFTKGAIDWSQSKAYASPPHQSGIFINLAARGPEGIVSAPEYEGLRDKIIEALGSIKDPRTGAPVVKGLRREECFSGPRVEHLPDIILDFGDSGVETKDAILNGRSLILSDRGMRGIHHRDGIFIAAGPKVKPGIYDGLELEDLAPNILALAGAGPPNNVDGKIRNDIFAFEDEPAAVGSSPRESERAT